MTKKEADETVRRYYLDIYKFCRAKSRSSDAAEDLTHDTFLVFYEKAETLTADNIRAWLYKTASNKLCEYFRKQKREQSFVSIYDAELPVYEPDLEKIGDTGENDFSEFQRRLLSLLNEEEKQLFILLYLRRKTLREAADECDISMDAAYQRKSRLKKKIRKHLSDLDFIFLFLSFVLLKNIC